MLKRQIRQRQLAEFLEVPEPRLSDLMKGKHELNMDFARRLYTKLNIPADVILTLQS
jgi:plasmid maintenance system antidote protein VapI